MSLSCFPQIKQQYVTIVEYLSQNMLCPWPTCTMPVYSTPFNIKTGYRYKTASKVSKSSLRVPEISCLSQEKKQNDSPGLCFVICDSIDENEYFRDSNRHLGLSLKTLRLCKERVSIMYDKSISRCSLPLHFLETFVPFKPFLISRTSPLQLYTHTKTQKRLMAQGITVEYCSEFQSVCVVYDGAKIKTGSSGNTLLHYYGSICVIHSNACIFNEGYIEIGRDTKLNMAQGSKLFVKKGARLYIYGELLLDRDTEFMVCPGVTHISDNVIYVAPKEKRLIANASLSEMWMWPGRSATWNEEEKWIICCVLRHFYEKTNADLFKDRILPFIVDRLCPMYGVLMPPPQYKIPKALDLRKPFRTCHWN